MKEIAAILNLLDAHPGAPAVLATLVRVDGSSYRRPGARLLCLPDGTRAGSISGGCLEEDLIERARRVLATGRAARGRCRAGGTLLGFPAPRGSRTTTAAGDG